ncbi:MAG: YicC family protein [Peptococcaceae bacterium]|nr:YicC family protein [Peptococcaceae bacterium]
MPRSMTGFGRGEAIGQGKRISVELKSVNHRFAEVVLRMPKTFFVIEERIKRQILKEVIRGRVDGFVSVEQLEEQSPGVKVDKGLATSYYYAIEGLFSDLHIVDPVKADYILTLPGVVTVEIPTEDADLLWPVLEDAFNNALSGLLEMRSIEGHRLMLDLLARLEKIRDLLAKIDSRAPVVVEEYRGKLTNRLVQWLEDSTLDINRVMAEVVIFAEKSSITEEIVRFYSHLDLAREALQGIEASGRKLDFIIQEMNREINTISSKSSDLQISNLVVEVKSELEKIREQVQNLE